MKFRAAFFLCINIATVGCSQAAPSTVAFDLEITIDVGLTSFDTVDVALSGIVPGQELNILAVQTFRGTDYCGWISAVPGSSSVENLRELKPVAGTYTHPDAMGVFWSSRPCEAVMTEVSSGIRRIFKGLLDDDSHTYRLAAFNNNRLGRAEFDQDFWPSEIGAPLVIQEPGVDLQIFEPRGNAAATNNHLVILLGGSEGIHLSLMAANLAMHGYDVATAVYFGNEFTAPCLHDVDVEDIVYALRRALVEVPDHSRVTLVGSSRGAEAAMLAVSKLGKQVDQLVLLGAHAFFFGGFVDQCPGSGSAWRLDGEPIPGFSEDVRITKDMVPTSDLARYMIEESLDGEDRSGAFYTRLLFESDPSAMTRFLIPVDGISQPVEIFAGTDDQKTFYWEAELLLNRINDGSPGQAHLHSYPSAGHLIGPAPSTLPNFRNVIRNSRKDGGTIEADAIARVQGWQDLLEVLDTDD